MSCTPQALMVEVGDAGYTALKQPQLGSVLTAKWYAYSQAPVTPPTPPFDGTLCNQTVTGGGGDLFDCYDVGTLTPTYFTGKDGGTGWSGVWIFAHAQFGEQFGDTFDSYPDGAAGTMGGGTGFSGNWGHD